MKASIISEIVKITGSVFSVLGILTILFRIMGNDAEPGVFFVLIDLEVFHEYRPP